MSKKKSNKSAFRAYSRRQVSTYKKLTTRGLVFGLGMLAFSPLEDALLGPLALVTAPFTATIGLGLMGSAVLLSDKQVTNLFLKASGIGDLLEGGGSSHGSSSGRQTMTLGGYADEDEPPVRSRRGKGLAGGALLLLGGGALAIWLLTANKRRQHAQLRGDLLLNQAA